MTDDETALYDRQIRVWGLEAQKNIRSFRVHVIGCNQLSSEILKNLCLVGIHITVQKCDKIYSNVRESCLLGKEYLGMRYSEALVLAMKEMNPTSEYAETEVEQPGADFICVCEKDLMASGNYFWCFQAGNKAIARLNLKNHTYLFKDELHSVSFEADCSSDVDCMPCSVSTNAVFGGMIAQEIVKIASKQGKLLGNYLEYDSNTFHMIAKVQ